MLSKIATAVDNLGVKQKKTRLTLDAIFDPESDIGIKQAYRETVEFDYDEQKAKKHVDNLNEFLDSYIDEVGVDDFDTEFLDSLSELKLRIDDILDDHRD